MRSAQKAGAAAAATLWLAACLCCSPAPRLYSTWASLGESLARTHRIEREAAPPPGARPWAGTASHHLLADALLDDWFRELAARRGVETFYVLSPAHYGISLEPYSLTDGSWRVGGGRTVRSDTAAVRALAKRLGVALEPTVFDPEHGVSTLVPYIAEYFPQARVVAVAYRGEPPLNQGRAKRLADALAPAFDAAGRERDFLLVSTDFSHHGTRARTDAKDASSRAFFDGPLAESWISAGCDNRPGIYVLAHLATAATRNCILYHTDSLALSGQGGTDITSYFFSYFWEP